MVKPKGQAGGFAKDLDMRNGYKGGVQVQLSYEVTKKKTKIALSFTSPEKDFFIYL